MTSESTLTLLEPLEGLAVAYQTGLCIGGVSVAIVASRRNSDVTLVPSLAPFQAEVRVPDITIRIEQLLGLPAVPARQIFDSGGTWRMYEGESGFLFDFYVAALGQSPYKRLLTDNSFSRATLQMSEQALASTVLALTPLGYPLDELLIMHRLTQEKAIELHGCGIVMPDGVGNLFVGHSGAGKSTTTRLWTSCEDVEVLSDDRIIVRLDKDEPDMQVPYGSAVAGEREGVPFDKLRAGFRLRDRSASRTSHSAQDDTERKEVGIRMYGTPWHGEAAFASPASAPLSRIFVLEHGRGNVLTRLSPSQAVAELFARSFVPLHRHEYVDSALSFLEHVANSVPCYRYAFEPDERAVERILNFHD